MAGIAKVIARQSRRPRGVLGRLWGPLLDRTTRTANGLVFEALALDGDVDVLEVGFGGGGLLARILDATQGHAAGLELSDVMVKRGERRFQREIRTGRLRLVQGEVSAMPFDDASFDRVASVHAIYFWPDTEAGLREILRTLRPGGALVLGTATKEFLSARRIAEHGYRLFSEPELHDALARAGFAEVAVERHDTVVITRAVKS